jgi:hypothetical protein
LIGRELEMMNVEGKRVLSQLLKSTNQAIDVQHLPAGVYFLEIGETVQKLLVE